MNRLLYNKIIHNISKGVKKSLNEDIQNFNPVDYNEDDCDIVDNLTVKNIIGFNYMDFDDIADKFRSLTLSKKSKMIFYPTFSIEQIKDGYEKTLYSYNFYVSSSPFATESFLKYINYIKGTDGVRYKLLLHFHYYNYSIFGNISGYMLDKCMTILRKFVIDYIKDINIDWLINSSLITITCTSREPFEDDRNRNGIINNVDEGLKMFKEILNRYIKYLNEHKDEFRGI